MDSQNLDIGFAVREMREAKEVTQEEVAIALGITVNFLSQVENGRRDLSTKKMEELASFFQVPVSFIYVLADDGKKKAVGLLQNLVYKSLAINPSSPKENKKKLKVH